MPKKRSKFLTVVFSLLPGAGHMFMGFMKMGLSLMLMFFAVIFLSSWLHIGALMYLIPIVIFYSFFDCINRCFAPDDEFARLSDHYLFSLDKLSGAETLFQGKFKLIAGIVLLLIGLDLLWNSFVNSTLLSLSYRFHGLLNGITDLIPRLVIGIAIIAIGVYLIIGKKRGIDKHD